MAKGRNITWERKTLTQLFTLQFQPVVPYSVHTMSDPHHFRWLQAFDFCLSSFDKKFLLPAGECSSCSWFSFALIPVGLISGCYCAPTRRSFSVSEALKGTPNPLPSLHTTYLQPEHLQFLNNSLGFGVYIKILTHQIPCGIWIMSWKVALWPINPGYFAL